MIEDGQNKTEMIAPCVEMIDNEQNKAEMITPCVERIENGQNKAEMIAPCVKMIENGQNKAKLITPCVEMIENGQNQEEMIALYVERIENGQNKAEMIAPCVKMIENGQNKAEMIASCVEIIENGQSETEVIAPYVENICYGQFKTEVIAPSMENSKYGQRNPKMIVPSAENIEYEQSKSDFIAPCVEYVDCGQSESKKIPLYVENKMFGMSKVTVQSSSRSNDALRDLGFVPVTSSSSETIVPIVDNSHHELTTCNNTALTHGESEMSQINPSVHTNANTENYEYAFVNSEISSPNIEKIENEISIPVFDLDIPEFNEIVWRDNAMYEQVNTEINKPSVKTDNPEIIDPNLKNYENYVPKSETSVVENIKNVCYLEVSAHSKKNDNNYLQKSETSGGEDIENVDDSEVSAHSVENCNYLPKSETSIVEDTLCVVSQHSAQKLGGSTYNLSKSDILTDDKTECDLEKNKISTASMEHSELDLAKPKISTSSMERSELDLAKPKISTPSVERSELDLAKPKISTTSMENSEHNQARSGMSRTSRECNEHDHARYKISASSLESRESVLWRSTNSTTSMERSECDTAGSEISTSLKCSEYGLSTSESTERTDSSEYELLTPEINQTSRKICEYGLTKSVDNGHSVESNEQAEFLVVSPNVYDVKYDLAKSVNYNVSKMDDIKNEQDNSKVDTLHVRNTEYENTKSPYELAKPIVSDSCVQNVEYELAQPVCINVPVIKDKKPKSRSNAVNAGNVGYEQVNSSKTMNSAGGNHYEQVSPSSISTTIRNVDYEQVSSSKTIYSVAGNRYEQVSPSSISTNVSNQQANSSKTTQNVDGIYYEQVNSSSISTNVRCVGYEHGNTCKSAQIVGRSIQSLPIKTVGNIGYELVESGLTVVNPGATTKRLSGYEYIDAMKDGSNVYQLVSHVAQKKESRKTAYEGLMKEYKFDVTIVQTPEVQDLGLTRHYILHLTDLSLILYDRHRANPIYTWYYADIRRYSYSLANREFAIYCGRNCPTKEKAIMFKVKSDLVQLLQVVNDKTGGAFESELELFKTKKKKKICVLS